MSSRIPLKSSKFDCKSLVKFRLVRRLILFFFLYRISGQRVHGVERSRLHRSIQGSASVFPSRHSLLGHLLPRIRSREARHGGPRGKLNLTSAILLLSLLQGHNSPATLFGSAFIAGVPAAGLVTPADVIKTRLQVSPFMLSFCFVRWQPEQDRPLTTASSIVLARLCAKKVQKHFGREQPLESSGSFQFPVL